MDPYVRAHLEKPAWVSGESSKYPLHLYLLGHGVSADLNLAKRQSVNELSNNLNMQIEKYLQQSVSSKNAFNTADIPKQQLMQNREFAETWQDPATKAYHVLAVIDRVKVGEDLLDEIYHLDEKNQRIMEKAQQQPDILQRIAFANMAIEKQQRRDKLQLLLAIIKPIATVGSSSWSEKNINQQINNWLSETKILPVAEQKDLNLLEAMRVGVQNAGFIVDVGVKPDYILKASFKQGQVKWKDGVYSLEGELKLQLMDGLSEGQVRGDAVWPIAVSATDRDQLSSQVEEAIKKVNEKNLKSTLIKLESD